MPNNFPYTTNVPNPPNLPSQDVGNMQTNTSSIYSLIAVDHVGFNFSGSGIHSRVQFPVASGGTITINDGSLMLYNRTITNAGGTQANVIWEKDKLGNDLPLFGPTAFSPTSGYVTLYGNIFLQFGQANVNGTNSTPVTFPKSFLTAVTSLTVTLQSNTFTYGVSDVSLTGFNFRIQPSAGSTALFYWTAIGQ